MGTKLLLSSNISNALDNALNAQKDLPVVNRQIRLMIKEVEGKVLLCLKTPVPVQRPS